MNKTKLASLFCLLVSVSVGCLPYPHAQHDYPEISGELVGPSGPLEGVEISPSPQRRRLIHVRTQTKLFSQRVMEPSSLRPSENSS